MNKREILNYEIKSSIWVGYISPKWAQNLAAAGHFARKVNRKWARYERNDRLRREWGL